MSLSARILRILFTLLIFLQLVTSLSYAQENKGGITLSPAFQEITIHKGQEEKKNLVIANNGSNIITLELFALDFRQEGEFGEISFMGTDTQSYSYSLASFISLETDTITIKPKSEETITVTIQDREGLSPGGHYAAIVAKLVQDEKEGNAIISPSISSLLLVRKEGGERFNLNLIENNWPDGFTMKYPENTLVKLGNEGNVHLIPYGTFTVTDFLGRKLFSGAINPSSNIILPEVRRYIQVDMHKISNSLPFSINEIVIKGNDSLKKTEYSHRGTFVYIHPLFAFIVLSGLSLLIIAKHKSKRKDK